MLSFLPLILFWFSLPEPLFTKPVSYVLEDKDRNLLGATVATDGQWRFPVMDSVPEKFAASLLAYEDKRFYRHWGVDPIAMGRALYKNIKNGKVVSGGSTISMQVIRLAYAKDRTVWQKIWEAVRAVRLEMRYSKEEILALYASHAPFGSNVAGLEAAAWRYYGRAPETLSWAEAAVLAVLPNAPSMIHPGKNRQKLQTKRDALLRRLHDTGRLTEDELLLALDEPLPEKPLALPQEASHLLQRIAKDNKQGGIRVRSTVDGWLQRETVRVLDRHHRELFANGIKNAAVLVMEVQTGNVLSYVGNVYRPHNPDLQSQVDIIHARRSPGSLLKPLLYAGMMGEGMLLPHALQSDIPTQIGGYMPQNFDLGYDGAVPASEVVSRSLNVPSVRMLREYNYQRFYRVLKQMGITTLDKSADHYGLSLILGGSEVTLWDMAGVYASLVRMYNHQTKNEEVPKVTGFFKPTYGLSEKRKQDIVTGGFPLDMASLWYMFSAMSEVMRPGEENLWQQFMSSKKVAWKTGTSFGFRDGWAIGFTPNHLVAVWTGNADGEGRPGLVGVRTAAPIMFDVFALLPSSGWFSYPVSGYDYISVCQQSGFKAGLDCPQAEEKMVPLNGSRTASCPYHRKIHLDETRQYRITERCEAAGNIWDTSWFVLPAAMEWYYKQRQPDYRTLPPIKPGCGTLENGMLEIVYPQQASKIAIPKELDGSLGEVVFSAVHKNSSATIFWHLDGNYIGETRSFHKMPMQPVSGRHLLTLVDNEGEKKTVWFTVE